MEAEEGVLGADGELGADGALGVEGALAADGADGVLGEDARATDPVPNITTPVSAVDPNN